MDTAIVVFTRDLRLHDNPALHAVSSDTPTAPASRPASASAASRVLFMAAIRTRSRTGLVRVIAGR